MFEESLFQILEPFISNVIFSQYNGFQTSVFKYYIIIYELFTIIFSTEIENNNCFMECIENQKYWYVHETIA